MVKFSNFDKNAVFKNLDIATNTSVNQEEVEKDVADTFVNFLTFLDINEDEAFDNAKLFRQSHAQFAIKQLSWLSSGASSMESSRTWYCFWGIHTLRLLNYTISEKLANNVITFLKSCHNSDGGFSGSPGQLSHLAPTYGAVMALLEIGTEEAYHCINQKSMFNFIKSLSVGDGSFYMHVGGEIDMRATYCAISIASILNLDMNVLFKGTAVWIRDSQTFEGGFGGLPDVEAHGGYTYCAVAGLSLLNKLNTIDLTNLSCWLQLKQMPFEGGFCGRTNKLVDACYSFWQGSIFAILKNFSKTEPNFVYPELDAKALEAFTLFISQDPLGGLKDKPGKPCDLYHTCYSLSGLSIAQHYHNENQIVGGENCIVESIDPHYNLTVKMVKVKKKASKIDKKLKLKKFENVNVNSSLLIHHEQGTKWYNNTYDDKATSENDLLTGDELKMLEEKASKLLQNDCNIFHKKNNTSLANINWMETILSKGTFNDKITAMQLSIKKSPVHSLEHLNSLVSICEKKKLRNLYLLIRLLKDIFLLDLLPSDRKLISFNQRPLARINELSGGDANVINRRLIMWKYESELKNVYHKFIKALDNCSSVVVENIANQSSSFLMDLLMERPEKESEILTMLVNQLGNPHKKNASYIIVLLKKLIDKHPSMKEVVIKEIETLIFRKNIPIKTQQYAVGFLTQIFLNVVEKNAAQILLKIYFALIKTLLAKENNECKLMDLVIVGVYRVLPYAKDRINEMSKEIESLYKLITVAKYSISMRTLRLVFKSSSIVGTVSDQFYASLYRFMFRDHPSKYQKDLFALVYDAVKHDAIFERQRAFIKRLFQIALVGLPELAAEALFTVGRLVKTNKNLILLPEHDYSGGCDVKKEEDDIAEVEVEDEDEVYYDYDIDEGGNIVKLEAQVDQNNFKFAVKTEEIEKNKFKITKFYNPHGLNPQYSKAHQSSDVELLYLKKHYHPIVSDFASKLIRNTEIIYKDDFKEDLSVIRFLDRFAFQKSKKSSKNSIKCLAVDSEEYIQMNPNKVPLDEIYLHRYARLKLSKSKNTEEDRFSINSDEFDEIIKNFNDQSMADDVMDSDDDLDIFEKELEEKQKVGKKRKRTSDAEKSLYEVLKGVDTEEPEDSEEEVGFENDDGFSSSDNDSDDNDAFINDDDDDDAVDDDDDDDDDAMNDGVGDNFVEITDEEEDE
ncbi:Farnesyltransferase, CAAX box, beta [Strongyloides ratti]|uniref:Protein farnesyltransferase subunit beta n=1 Tax=Strongyloides ratti TaxID=34506 RepID=A0A090KZQ2_STRRB|nr:Farnesyltransferase, CAAX box, beta [Strongyloides ratti]CEF63010.1 Farnesyltransferase, CAAX box, beta [Strongyloides ratti]